MIMISTARLGLTLQEAGRLYLGRWADIFDAYKKQYNFETRRGLYLLEEEPASLDVL